MAKNREIDKKKGGNKEGIKRRKETGKKFEENIKKSLNPTTYWYRLRDNPGAWGDGKKEARFTPTNLCDFVIFFNGKLYMTEAKSTKGKSLPFSNIKNSQIKGFKKLRNHKNPNVYGIFLVEFSELGQVYAVTANQILKYMEETERKSFPLIFFKKEGIKLEIKKGKRKQVNIEKGIIELLNKIGEL